MVESFQTGAWLGWVNQLPARVIRVRPVLCTQIGWAHMDAGNVHASESSVEDAEQSLNLPASEIIVTEKGQVQTLPARIAFVRAYNAQSEHRFSDAVQYAEMALELAPREDDFMHVQVSTLLMGTHWANGDRFVALGQRDMKKLIAYSSVAHMGFVTLGIFLFTLRGLEGALMVMLNHGITTGGLFMLVGCLYERSHSREIAANTGLGKHLPAYMFFFGLFAPSSLGFPGTNSFVGEALVLIGAFGHNPWVGGAAVPGVMLGAAYMLRLGQKLAWGEPTRAKGWKDLNLREWVYFAPLAVLVIYIGLAPGLTLWAMDPTLTRVLGELRRPSTAASASAEAAAAPLGWASTTRTALPSPDPAPVRPR